MMASLILSSWIAINVGCNLKSSRLVAGYQIVAIVAIFLGAYRIYLLAIWLFPENKAIVMYCYCIVMYEAIYVITK